MSLATLCAASGQFFFLLSVSVTWKKEISFAPPYLYTAILILSTILFNCHYTCNYYHIAGDFGMGKEQA